MDEVTSMVVMLYGDDPVVAANGLAKDYNYKPLPPEIAHQAMGLFVFRCPEEFLIGPPKEINGYNYFEGQDKTIYTIPQGEIPSLPIAKRYERMVVGHYGAFLEINDKDIIRENIKIQEGEEYRVFEPHYARNCKYQWFTDTHNLCKLYYQQKPAKYADYKPGFWYVSPHEVYLEKYFQ